MNVTKVLVVDDHPLIAEGLKLLLGRCFEITWMRSTGVMLLDAIEQLHLDIILLGTHTPHFIGLPELKQLQDQGCSARVVILTTHADPDYAAATMQAGAAAFLLKQSSIEELRWAIQEVVAGRHVVSSELPSSSRKAATSSAADSPPETQLTKRQLEVLRLFAEGYSAKSVARMLFISKRTAENHKASIKRLTGAGSTAELVRMAIRRGLISPQ